MRRRCYAPPVFPRPRRPPSRRNWILFAILGLFIVSDFALFSWLIFQTLSRRELDRVLLETRQEAQDLAQRIAGSAESTGGDLFTAVAFEREDRRRDAVEEPAIVRDDQRAAREIDQALFERT